MNPFIIAAVLAGAAPPAPLPPEDEPRECPDGFWRQRIKRWDPYNGYIYEVDEPTREQLEATIKALREQDAAAEAEHISKLERDDARRREAMIRHHQMLDATEPERRAAAEAQMKRDDPERWRRLQAERWNAQQRGKRRGSIGGSYRREKP